MGCDRGCLCKLGFFKTRLIHSSAGMIALQDQAAGCSVGSLASSPWDRSSTEELGVPSTNPCSFQLGPPVACRFLDPLVIGPFLNRRVKGAVYKPLFLPAEATFFLDYNSNRNTHINGRLTSEAVTMINRYMSAELPIS